MSTDVLEKLKMLPPDKQQQAVDYIDQLLAVYKSEKEETEESIAEKRRRNMGRLKGQIWMADDFNETPEDFKDYL